jgi:hypothetical protein
MKMFCYLRYPGRVLGADEVPPVALAIGQRWHTERRRSLAIFALPSGDTKSSNFGCGNWPMLTQ